MKISGCFQGGPLSQVQRKQLDDFAFLVKRFLVVSHRQMSKSQLHLSE